MSIARTGFYLGVSLLSILLLVLVLLVTAEGVGAYSGPCGDRPCDYVAPPPPPSPYGLVTDPCRGGRGCGWNP